MSSEQIKRMNVVMIFFVQAQDGIRDRQWLHGQITAGAVIEEFRRLAPRREVSFRTELVDGQAALFEARVPGRNRKAMESEVTDKVQRTFGSAFKPAFEGNARQAEEK